VASSGLGSGTERGTEGVVRDHISFDVDSDGNELDTVDELVFDNVTVHFEMSSEVSAYMTIEQGKRLVFVQFDVHELTSDERAEYRVRHQSRRAPKAAIVARIEHDTEDGF
jgi:hypothetical protein